MTVEEIKAAYKMEYLQSSVGKSFNQLNGKPVSGIKTVLWYSNGKSCTSQGRLTFDKMFFHLVRTGKVERPSDIETCPKCGGSGNVGYGPDGGICYKCLGLGYQRTK